MNGGLNRAALLFFHAALLPHHRQDHDATVRHRRRVRRTVQTPRRYCAPILPCLTSYTPAVHTWGEHVQLTASTNELVLDIHIVIWQ
jgi:hypothetical protein